LVAGLVGRVGRADLWMRVAPIVSSLGDRRIVLHEPSEEVQRRVNTGELLFPLPVGVSEQANTIHLILAPLTLQKQDRILEINGQAAEDLLFRFSMLYSDPLALNRAMMAAAAFPDLLLLHGIPAPFEVRVARPDGTEYMETVPGVKPLGVQRELIVPKGGQIFRLPHSKLAASVSR
jgi:hypothetical protein